MDRFERELRHRMPQMDAVHTHIEMATTQVAEGARVPQAIETRVQAEVEQLVSGLQGVENPHNLIVRYNQGEVRAILYFPGVRRFGRHTDQRRPLSVFDDRARTKPAIAGCGGCFRSFGTAPAQWEWHGIAVLSVAASALFFRFCVFFQICPSIRLRNKQS